MVRPSFAHRPSVCTAAIVCLSLVIAIGGCNGKSKGPSGQVSGKVTLEGTPVTEGKIVFDNAATATSISADLGADGAYTVKTLDNAGLPVGEYRVAVQPATPGRESPELLMKPVRSESKIPERYRSLDKSDLKFTVAEGDNTYNVDLKP